MSLFKTNTTETYSELTHVRTFFGGRKKLRKQSEDKIIKAIEDRIIKDIRKRSR